VIVIVIVNVIVNMIVNVIKLTSARHSLMYAARTFPLHI
jgi:hypothetical protein